MILEKALNKRILQQIEKLQKTKPKTYRLLRKTLWEEYLNRTKQTWHYSQWYAKQIDKEVAEEN